LRADDLAGLLYIYGRSAVGSLTPPATAPTDVSVVTQSAQLTVTWKDENVDQTRAASSYRVDFRSGHADGGSIVASVSQTGTALTVAVPPGVAGAFNVVVTGVNAAGTGPSSARHDFLLNASGSSCTGAPAAVTDLSGSVSRGFARVQWSPVPGATRYLVQAGSTPGGSDLFALTDLGASTGAGSAVGDGFAGWVRVFAANACGVSNAADIFVQ
jgi:hypothetical protein